MSDRLDKDLSRHIREVFDAYDEPYDPLSWQRLQRKRRGKVMAGYLKWVGAAASVAILLTAGILLWNGESVMNEPLLTGREPGTEEEWISAPDKMPADNGNTLSGDDVLSDGEASAGDGASAGSEVIAGDQLIAGDGRSPQETVASVSGGEEMPSAGLVPEDSPEETAGKLAAGRNVPSGEAELESNAAVSTDESTLAAGKEAPAAGKEAPSGKLPGQVSDETLAAGQELAAAEELAAGQQGEVNAYSAYEEEKDEQAGAGRFSVGFVTTSLMNYANGNTANKVHFGAGITSGWELSDRLSVHSGLILAENSLSLNRSNSSVRAMAAMAAPSSRPETTVISAVGDNRIVQNISPNSMDVNLLVVDIPLNLTYRVDVGRSNLLLTGGLSSFAYLDQEYRYHNTMQLYTNASVDAPEPVVRDENAFSHFDFAKQLNLAIGTELPLGKGSVLIVEPYVKYPLGTLTSEQIRFGSAGMNLRLSFGSK